MSNERTATPGMRLIAAALSATIATAGLGLFCGSAFAEEPAAPEPAAAPTPAAGTVRVSSLAIEQTAAAEGTAVGTAQPSIGVIVPLTNGSSEAAGLYDAIDQLRANNGLPALTRDADLQAGAYQRAAESTLLLSYIRPDGTFFTTVNPGQRIAGEILVAGDKNAGLDAAAVIASLGEAQLALLNAPESTNIGIAQVSDAQGNTYWAIELSRDALPSGEFAEIAPTATYRAYVSSANLPLGATGELALEAGVGQLVAIPATTAGEIATLEGVAVFSGAAVNVDGSTLVWNTSDPAVATVDATGTAYGVASGSCTVSATSPLGHQFIFPVTVTGGDPAASTVNLADCIVAGITGPYEYTGAPIEPTFSVIDAHNITVDPNQYTYAFSDNVEPGTATLTISARENGAVVGELVKTFEISAPAVVQVPVPYIIGSYADDAAAALADLGLTANVVEGEPAADESAAGMVYATDPGADSIVDAGTQVTLTVYAAPAAPAEPIDQPAEPGEPVEPATVATSIEGATLGLSATTLTYTGAPLEPAVTLTLTDGTGGSVTLVQGVDYEVAYSNNVDVTSEENPALVTVTGINAYAGTLQASFQIAEAAPTQTDLAAAGYAIAPIDTQLFTGTEVRPVVNLSGPVALTEGVDYIVSYENNAAAGTGRAIVTGQGAYKGTLSADFKIQGDLTQASVSGLTSQVYTGAAITPNPTVTIGETVLTAGTDYSVSYTNNVNVGEATLAISGLGNYAGTVEAAFSITPKSVKGAQISPIASTTYTGSVITPAITVTDGTSVLVSATDYTVAYEQNINAGTAHVVVTGVGNYCDSIDTTFVIAPINMNRVTVTMPNMAYTGSALTPKPVSVTVDGLTLVEGVDYDIVGYAGNVNVGDAKTTLQGKGNFTGTVTANWKIVQQGASNSGTTQTLPQTGDSTNTVVIVVGVIVGVVLIGAAIVLIVRHGRSGKHSRR